MLRHTLSLGVGLIVVAGASNAQQRGGTREDLLDALTRHIQICTEMNDSQERLSCYDRLQTKVGGVQSTTPSTPQPTPLGAANRPAGPNTGGLNPSPLSPPPLTTPGGGVATLGGQPGQQEAAGAQPADPDKAFDPRGTGSGYRPPEGMMPKPQPALRRTGARPIPTYSTQQPLVTLAANNLTYGDARYWQVTIILTSTTPRTLDTQVQCSFMNAGRSVSEAYFGPVPIQGGEQISTELIGPPTTAYVDATNCRILSP